MTAVIHLHEHTAEQLDALVRQSRVPDAVVLVTPSTMVDQARAIARHYAHIITTSTVIQVVSHDQQSPDDHASFISFLRHSIDSDWVWMLDIHARPGTRHLEFMHNLAHTKEYSGASLGFHGVLLPSNMLHPPPSNAPRHQQLLCLPHSFNELPNVTQPVDMLQGAWFLKRTWLQHLEPHVDQKSGDGGPWSFYLSQHLLHDAQIPSIVIPTHPDPAFQLAMHVDYCPEVVAAYEKDIAWKHVLQRHTSLTALDQRQRTMMINYDAYRAVFVARHAKDLVALHPLLCRMYRSDQHRQTQLHVVVMGDLLGQFEWPTTSCLAGDTSITMHTIMNDVDSNKQIQPTWEMMRVIDVLGPHLLFHVADDDDRQLQALHSLSRTKGITPIALPEEQVSNALWISDLPVVALQRKRICIRGCMNLTLLIFPLMLIIGWNDIDVELIVITDRRSHSLARLLQALSRSLYFNDKVQLKIYMEQSADLTTRHMVNEYAWPYGTKTVRHRSRKGGLISAITESWYPSSNDNYAVLLEDDIEVSPLFYVWTKYTVLKYRYDPHNRDMSMFGVSLYTPRNVPVYMDGRHAFNPEEIITSSSLPYPGPNSPYVTTLPCSWGAVYFPEHWREFHEYIMERVAKPKKVYNITVPESRSETWHFSWKKFYIEMAYLRAYVMLYPNFEDWTSFSTNHLEIGQHIKEGTRTEEELRDFQVPLMETDVMLAQLPNHRLPTYDALPVLDLWGRRTTMEGLTQDAIKLHPQISTCPRSPGRFRADDLLCPFSNPTFNTVKSKGKGKSKEAPPETIVQPIKYIYVSTNVQVPDDVLPRPINVSQMDSPVLKKPEKDDELLDILSSYSSANISPES